MPLKDCKKKDATYLTDRLGGEEEGVALDVSVGVNHCDERCGGEARKRCR